MLHCAEARMCLAAVVTPEHYINPNNWWKADGTWRRLCAFLLGDYYWCLAIIAWL